MDSEELRRIRESTERGHGVIERNTVAFEGMMDALQDLRTVTIGMQEALRDMREQIQANTQAVLRVLDRLDGGAASP